MATNKITDFKKIYSESKNENSANVFERMPIGISWEFDSRIYTRFDAENRLCASVDYTANSIAIVEVSKRNSEHNRAVVIDAVNNEIFDVKRLFKKLYALQFNIYTPFIFFDVYDINGVTNFFVHIDGVDFRFSFNTITGELGKLIESR